MTSEAGVGALVMRVLSPNGDDRFSWDRRFPAQVREAQAKFDELTAKGYKAFRGGGDGGLMPSFDANAEEIIFQPPIVGG